MSKLTPIKDRVAVVRLKSKLESDSGIIIESNRSEYADQAKVIAVGPTVDLVKVGDTILLDWRQVQQTIIEGAPVFLLSQNDIHGVIEN
jgi:co-chaperonin GroES (HSP10)